jgi:hypothetical protein
MVDPYATMTRIIQTTRGTFMEEWRDVPSTNNLIQVSNTGKARRKARPLIYKDGRKGTLPPADLRLTLCTLGYHTVSFSSKHLLVHRLVAEAFLPEPESKFAKQTINHKNGIKTDNRVENLEWATAKDNAAHARATGLNNQHGENTNLSKYSDRFIAAVRNVHAKYHPTWEELGRLFGLSGAHARQIVKYETRKKETVSKSI